MAKIVKMKHPETGLVKRGFIGFSWTTLFFGGFPALFRGDIKVGLFVFVLNILSFFLAGIIWAFFYNRSYTTRLVERGYKFADGDAVNALARSKIGVEA
jgi:hypothetical protein